MEPDAPVAGKPRTGTAHRRSPAVAAVVAAVGLVVLAAVGLVIGRHRSKPVSPGASAAQINGRLSVQRSQAIVVLGDKVVARPVQSQNGTGPLGVIRLAVPQSPSPPVLRVEGSTVLAQGTDLSGDGRTGTWAYSVSGERRSTFLGTSDGFVPAVDDASAWLISGSTVRMVAVSDGKTVEGPYALDGLLVASVGSGLLLQRGGEVVSWLPDTPAGSRIIGTGRALAGLGAYVLWQAADGRLTITDSYTGQIRRTAVRLPPGQSPTAVAVSGDLYRVAAVAGMRLVVGDAMHGHAISVRLGPIKGVAWLDDNTLVAQVGARGLVAVDASSGTTAPEPNFPFDVGAFSLLQPPT